MSMHVKIGFEGDLFMFRVEGLPTTDQECQILAGQVQLLQQLIAAATPPKPLLAVKILDSGTTRIQVIKALRAHTDFGLAQAKAATEDLPHVQRFANIEKAAACLQDVIAAGATAELVP